MFKANLVKQEQLEWTSVLHNLYFFLCSVLSIICCCC